MVTSMDKLHPRITGVDLRAPVVRSAAMGAGSPAHATLVFMRHGQSVWNEEGIFTGWVDVDLSEKGLTEAAAGGKLLKDEGIKVDIAFTSYLKRAMKTCNLALENADQLYIPVKKTWRLNERMYGGLTGKNKKASVEKYGKDQVLVWRRSFDVPPTTLDKDDEYHPSREAKYKDLKPEEIPDTECLKDVIARVIPYWEENIEPELKAGKTVFVAAHGNSIRAILQFLEGIPEDAISGLEVPTGIPLVYKLDADLKPLPSDTAVPPLKYGSYLGDLEAAKAAADAVKQQT
jgi:2,3-bisphosphoglycerate-dependent phosphoglycerate mutase